jgi:hypothetical protein
MGRNEIKLRRTSVSEGNLARHRNYGLLMKKHHRDLRIRRLTIVLIYVLMIIAILAIFIVVKRDEQQRKVQPERSPSTAMVYTSGVR